MGLRISRRDESSQEKQLLSKQIVGLDALRMSAALLVLVFHLFFDVWTPYMNPTGVPTHAFDFLWPVAWFGWIGVQIFFVMSGFVIAYSAHHVSAATFLQHRLTRLLPAAVLCATLTALLILAGGKLAFFEIAVRWTRSVLFLPFSPYIDDSYWTLSVELAFYAVVYIVLLFKRIDRLAAVMAGIGCLSTLHWILETLFQTLRLWPRYRYWVYGPFRVFAAQPDTLLFHGCYFCLGVFLWLSLFHGFTPRRLTVLCICGVGGVLEIYNRTLVYIADSRRSLHASIPLGLWLLSLGVIVASTRGNARIQHAIGERGIKALRRLGLMTYPLYLLHQTIGKMVILACQPRIGSLSALTLAILVALTLSYAVSAFFEPPIQRWMKGLFLGARALERERVS